ncbi:MAG: uroporphyrinogen-III synthase [Vibrio sp.]|uniref:uroporphyrinogen-III synthase n=1 Tax=Vibrio sp. TaxID=678 RepID=UPI003EE65953
MTVLVTRPAEQGAELCQQLHQQGIAAVQHPLITLSASPQLVTLTDHFASCDIIIAVSQHAVHFSHQWLQHQHHNWPTRPLYLAVGQKTAHVLSKACQQSVDYPSISDSEHLLALNALQQVAGKHIVILRGNGGRELIHTTLTERGAKVDYQEAYCREQLRFCASERVAQWQQAQVSSLVITSAEQLDFFIGQLDGLSLIWAQTLTLLVPSQRIAAHAAKLGFDQIVIAASASNQDFVAALMPQATGTLSNDRPA